MVILVTVGIVIGIYVTVMTFDNNRIKNQVMALHPAVPEEIITGQVSSMTVTTNYSIETNAGNKISATIYLCSGDIWNIPTDQIDIVEKYLKQAATRPGCP